jgi:hypothetical protein
LAEEIVVMVSLSAALNAAGSHQFELPLGRSPADVRRRIEMLEKVLERLFVIPGIKQPIGLDAILDLIPVAGDVIGAALGLVLVWEARNLGLSRWKMARMFGNIGINAALGAIPVIGFVPDLLFRSNSRNLKIIVDHLDRHYPETRILEG